MRTADCAADSRDNRKKKNTISKKGTQKKVNLWIIRKSYVYKYVNANEKGRVGYG